jgi:transposase-like protein
MTIPDEDPQASRPLPPRTLEELRRVVQLAREGGVELRLGPRSLAILEGMLERPEDVTLRSIAEIARAYGVSPSTLTRLARRLASKRSSVFFGWMSPVAGTFIRSRHSV